jgi:hypothetical protein
MPPPAVPPGVTTTNLLFPAPCLVNQANGYHVTDPGYFVKLSDSSGTLIAAAPMTLDAVTRGSTCQGEYIYGCFNFNIALSFLGKNLKNGSYTGKFSMCHAKDTAVPPASAECQNLGPDDNLMPFIRVFQHIDLEVGYDVKDNAIEITKYDGGPWDKKLWKQLIVYHPIFAFINPDICQKDFSSPLAFDLNGDDRLDLSDAWTASGGVLFDIAASGTKVRTGWVAKEDGFLVLGNRVLDGRSLFGEYSLDRTDLSRRGKTFTNGFAALAQYDDNKDNVISSRDAVWSKLNLWRDLNQDGIAQASELKPLDFYHVVDIKLSYVNAPQINANNKMILKSSFRDQWNKNHPIYDVWFNVRRDDKTSTNSKGL